MILISIDKTAEKGERNIMNFIVIIYKSWTGIQFFYKDIIKNW